MSLFPVQLMQGFPKHIFLFKFFTFPDSNIYTVEYYVIITHRNIDQSCVNKGHRRVLSSKCLHSVGVGLQFNYTNNIPAYQTWI